MEEVAKLVAVVIVDIGYTIICGVGINECIKMFKQKHYILFGLYLTLVIRFMTTIVKHVWIA